MEAKKSGLVLDFWKVVAERKVASLVCVVVVVIILFF